MPPADNLSDERRDPRDSERFYESTPSALEAPTQRLGGDVGGGQGSSAGPAAPDEVADARREALMRRGFIVAETLGRGGFGEVYHCWDRSLERDVAVKVLRRDLRYEQFRERFVREARILAGLRHENVVKVHSVEDLGGEIAIVLEFIRGQTLDAIVKSSAGLFSAREAASIGVDLCRALAVLHHAGLVHRDVKPGNVIRERGGRTVLLDFGLCRGPWDPAITQEGQVLGTPIAMSPEQLAGKDVDHRSDIYSLGVLLYYLVSARFPSGSASSSEVHDRIAKGNLIPLSDACPTVPKEFQRIVNKAFAFRPEERYPSAGAMEEALLRFLGSFEATPEALVSTASQAAGRRSRLRRWMLAGAAGLIVAASLALYFLVGQGTRGPDFRVLLHRLRVEGEEVVDKVLKKEGDTVRLGDRIYLELEAAKPAYAYVFNSDDEGRGYVLFPSPVFAARNPLVAGVRHVLPGPRADSSGRALGTEPYYWQVDSPSKVEFFYVFVGDKPLPPAEMQRDSMLFAEQAKLAIAGTRGAGGASPLPISPEPEPMRKQMDGLLDELEREAGVWAQRLEFRQEFREE